VYPDGTPIANAPVFVRLRGSYELAALYADAAETATAENPVITTGIGELVFYAAPGYYDLVYNNNEFPITVGNPSGGSASTSYTHVQSVASMTWIIRHNLGFQPGGVRVVQSTGEEIVGSVSYPDVNTVQINFSSLTAGVAYLS